jgi:hypothetical protein
LVPAAPPPPVLKECCVCLFDMPAADLLLIFPCGHRCICGACVAMLEAQPPAARRCPKCREPLLKAVRVFED